MLIMCVLCCIDATGPDGLQGTFSVLLMVAWTSVIKGLFLPFWLKLLVLLMLQH